MTARILLLDQTGQLGGAELFLADVAARYAENGAVTLFQDGPFCALLEKLGVSVSICPLGAKASAIGKASFSGFRFVPIAPWTCRKASSPVSGLDQASSVRKSSDPFSDTRPPITDLRSQTSDLPPRPHFLLSTFYLLLSTCCSLLSTCLRVAHQARSFDLIYANTAKALIVGGFAAFLSRRPLVYHLHDIISADHFSAFNRRLLVAFGNRAQAVIANSEATRRSFIESGGREDLTHIVYNGFDPQPFADTTADDRTALRQELGVGDASCALMVGRLTPWKGQHLLLEALRTLPGVHAVIAGDALFTEEDRQYADRLKKDAADPQLAGRVHFLGFRDDLPRWYGMADLVIHASTPPEPFGRVIVEGMLAGKPVIATRGGGASEILSDLDTGYLITPNDSDEIAAAIRAILADPAAASAMGERAREHARRHFSKESVLTAIDRIIETLVPPSSRTSHT